MAKDFYWYSKQKKSRAGESFSRLPISCLHCRTQRESNGKGLTQPVMQRFARHRLGHTDQIVRLFSLFSLRKLMRRNFYEEYECPIVQTLLNIPANTIQRVKCLLFNSCILN